MNLDIVTEKPLWYGLFCLFIGATGALLLYYRDNRFDETKPWLTRVMATFRFVVLSILAFLLLTPMLRSISRTIEKPIIVIAQDNSQSIVQGNTMEYMEKTYKPAFDDLVTKLKNDYEVRTLSFGDAVSEKTSFDFSDMLTNYTTLFEELHVKYANRNLAGLILASDGIYNQGSSPLYSIQKLNTPVYSIALGDTSTRKDLVLTRVNHNKISFIGNAFPLEVMLDARQCAGGKTQLTISKDSVLLITRSIDIPGNRYHQTVQVFLEAKEKGVAHYKVSLSVLDGEINKLNNSTDVFIEVAESKQKVLILAHAPHPDIACIRSILEGSQNYEVSYQLAKNYEGNLNDYNLVILHQVPSGETGNGTLAARIMDTDAAVFFILGSQTDVNAFNKLEPGLNISVNGTKTTEAQAHVDLNFSLFTLSEGLARNFTAYPPLVTPFGNYKNTADNHALLYQQIGNVLTTQPLLVFNPGSKHKHAILCGEGFWKWRLHEFSETNQSNLVDEVLLKTVQYLSAKERKSPFRLLHKNSFAENEPLQFDAELYNESQELINTPDVKITLVNDKKVSYPFTFSKTERAYTLNAGFFPVGNYRFRAEVKLGDKSYIDNGEFSVSPLQLEQAESRADHQLLYALSDKSGGSMVYPSNMQDLVKKIHSREDIKPVIYSQKKLQDLVNLKWVFFLLMALLSAEWFLRKRSGAY